MSKAHRAVVGDYNATCDRCGFSYKASQLIETWDGFMVDVACWETRHIQDFLETELDDESIPWSRSEPQETDSTYTRTIEKADGTLEQAVPSAIIDLDDALPAPTFPDGSSTADGNTNNPL